MGMCWNPGVQVTAGGRMWSWHSRFGWPGLDVIAGNITRTSVVNVE